MTDSSTNSSAEGYKQASLSVQKVDGEKFIHTDVFPQAGDAILDLGCGTGEPSAYLAELVGPEGKVIRRVLILRRNEFRWLGKLTVISRILRLRRKFCELQRNGIEVLYPLLDQRLTTLCSAMLPSTGYLGNKKFSRTCLKVLKLEAK